VWCSWFGRGRLQLVEEGGTRLVVKREEQGWLALSNRNTETTCVATGPYNSHWSIQ